MIGSWKGRKTLGRDFSEYKLVRVELQETNNFFFRPYEKCIYKMRPLFKLNGEKNIDKGAGLNIGAFVSRICKSKLEGKQKLYLACPTGQVHCIYIPNLVMRMCANCVVWHPSLY